MTATSDRPALAPRTTSAGDAGPTSQGDARVDVAALEKTLLGRWADLRAAARATAGEEAFQRIEGQSLREHRERVLEQMHLLVGKGQVWRGYPERLGGADDAGGNLAGFEELVAADPSLQIKAGVQWGLFG
ncbi:hypothetical protein LVR47_29070, partial [Pseudomonas aeruginosa]